jgi:hypothetical protein
MDDDLLSSEIGDEDFFEQCSNWKPDAKQATRAGIKQAMTKVDSGRRKAGRRR